MGSFLAYTLYSGVFLLLLYLVYKLFISKEKQIALNRVILLGCYVVSFAVWPLSRLDWNQPEPQLPVAAPVIAVGELSMNAVGIVQDDSSAAHRILLWIYLIGALAVLLKTLFSTARLFFYIRKGTFIRKEGYTLVIMPGNDTAPFSFGSHIVMSEADYDIVRSSVTMHELAHIRYRHYLDLIIVAQAVCVVLWYNPAAWLMRDELKLIHEYQADAAVIDSGADPKEYQMLLIRKTVGNRFHTLANSLNHSKLKNRIEMMQKEKSTGRRRLRLLSLALAVDVALAVVNMPAVAYGFDSFESVSLKYENSSRNDAVPESDDLTRTSADLGVASSTEPRRISNSGMPSEVSKSKISVQTDTSDREKEVSENEDGFLDVVGARFPGGGDNLIQYLSMNIRHPQSAQAENRTGKPVVGFTVNDDGSVSDVRIVESAWPDLDEEAMRVVRKMPKWTPAMSGGKSVSSEMFLPIDFCLLDNAGIPERNSHDITDDTDGKNSEDIEVMVLGTIKMPDYAPSKSGLGMHEYGGNKEKQEYHTSNSGVKWYKGEPVGKGTSPDAPVYLDGVLSDKSKAEGLDSKSIESIHVYQSSDRYPKGAVFITSKKEKNN